MNLKKTDTVIIALMVLAIIFGVGQMLMGLKITPFTSVVAYVGWMITYLRCLKLDEQVTSQCHLRQPKQT